MRADPDAGAASTAPAGGLRQVAFQPAPKAALPAAAQLPCFGEESAMAAGAECTRFCGLHRHRSRGSDVPWRQVRGDDPHPLGEAPSVGDLAAGARSLLAAGVRAQAVLPFAGHSFRAGRSREAEFDAAWQRAMPSATRGWRAAPRTATTRSGAPRAPPASVRAVAPRAAVRPPPAPRSRPSRASVAAAA